MLYLRHRGPSFSQADLSLEKSTEKAKFENEKKGLEKELARVRDQLRGALQEKTQAETLQKALARLDSDKLRLTDELRCCRTELEAASNALKANEQQLRRKESDLQAAIAETQLKSKLAEDTIKERDALETKVFSNPVLPEVPVVSFFSALRTEHVQAMKLEVQLKMSSDYRTKQVHGNSPQNRHRAFNSGLGCCFGRQVHYRPYFFPE
jgi:DNA repair exonuclease SbcCD ATPase subunit